MQQRISELIAGIDDCVLLGDTVMWNKKLWFSDCIRVDDKIWFASGNYNGLYCYDITDHKVEWIADFPEELFNVEQLFFKTRIYKDNLIFIPLDAEDVHIFNLTSKQFTKIGIPRIPPARFTDGRVFGKYLYLFGCRYYGILRVDLESKKIETVDGVLEQIEQGIVMDRKEPLFGLQAAEIENKVYLPFWQSNRLVEYDMENGVCRCYEVGSETNRYYGVCQIKDGLALLTWNDGCVVFWYGEYFEEVVYCEDYSLDKHLCVMDDAVWIIPNRTKKLYKIDVENKKVREFWIDENDDNEKDIEFAEVYKNQLFLCDTMGNWYRVSNGREETVEKLCLKLEEPRSHEELVRNAALDLTRGEPVCEGGLYSIDCLMESLRFSQETI